jgi:hypothetical protein
MLSTLLIADRPLAPMGARGPEGVGARRPLRLGFALVFYGRLVTGTRLGPWVAGMLK